ncbi:baculoviral IAP repeat-containing protein 8-like [Crassostrea virginica]
MHPNSNSKLQVAARYSEFSGLVRRVQTLKAWPRKRQAEQLAEAGFFSAQTDDLVRCFQCGLGLRNWDPEDNPWVEHARWKPDCLYLIRNTSDEFIARVQEAVRSENCAAVENGSSKQNDVEQDCPPVNSKKANTNEYEYPESTYEKNPLLTTAAQSVLEFGYLPKTVKLAIDNILGNIGGWRNLTGTEIMKEIFRLEDNGLLHQRKSNINISLSPEEAMKENESLKESKLCKICCDRTIAIVFLPCGHLVCCGQCAPALKKCPVCRKAIKGSTRVTFAS